LIAWYNGSLEDDGITPTIKCASCFTWHHYRCALVPTLDHFVCHDCNYDYSAIIAAGYKPFVQYAAQPLSATPSYYSDVSMSSSPSVTNWASDSRRDEYIGPRREQYNSIHDRHTPHQHQPVSHYGTQEQVPVAAPASYQWKQDHTHPSQYYTSQPEQPYTHPAHHDNYQQLQSPILTPAVQDTHQPLPPPSELADLGLAARDLTLDEMWSAFIRDLGYLDGRWTEMD